MLPFGSFSHTSAQVPALLLVILVFLVFPRSPLFLVCFLGIVHMCHRLWQGDCTCKQVVNRLKIPQGLSTLLFHRWSEVPSRGGVRGDSPYEKLPALQRCYLSVFSECCFLELLASLLLLELFFLVVLLFFLVLCRALFFSEWFS